MSIIIPFPKYTENESPSSFSEPPPPPSEEPPVSREETDQAVQEMVSHNNPAGALDTVVDIINFTGGGTEAFTDELCKIIAGSFELAYDIPAATCTILKELTSSEFTPPQFVLNARGRWEMRWEGIKALLGAAASGAQTAGHSNGEFDKLSTLMILETFADDKSKQKFAAEKQRLHAEMTEQKPDFLSETLDNFLNLPLEEKRDFVAKGAAWLCLDYFIAGRVASAKNISKYGTPKKPPVFMNTETRDLFRSRTVESLSLKEIRRAHWKKATNRYDFKGGKCIFVEYEHCGEKVLKIAPEGFCKHPELSRLSDGTIPDVLLAGEMKIKKGKISAISNSSGHFMTSGQHLEETTIHSLQQFGFKEARPELFSYTTAPISFDPKRGFIKGLSYKNLTEGAYPYVLTENAGVLALKFGSTAQEMSLAELAMLRNGAMPNRVLAAGEACIANGRLTKVNNVLIMRDALYGHDIAPLLSREFGKFGFTEASPFLVKQTGFIRGGTLHNFPTPNPNPDHLFHPQWKARHPLFHYETSDSNDSAEPETPAIKEVNQAKAILDTNTDRDTDKPNPHPQHSQDEIIQHLEKLAPVLEQARSKLERKAKKNETIFNIARITQAAGNAASGFIAQLTQKSLEEAKRKQEILQHQQETELASIQKPLHRVDLDLIISRALNRSTTYEFSLAALEKKTQQFTEQLAHHKDMCSKMRKATSHQENIAKRTNTDISKELATEVCKSKKELSNILGGISTALQAGASIVSIWHPPVGAAMAAGASVVNVINDETKRKIVRGQQSHGKKVALLKHQATMAQARASLGLQQQHKHTEVYLKLVGDVLQDPEINPQTQLDVIDDSIDEISEGLNRLETPKGSKNSSKNSNNPEQIAAIDAKERLEKELADLKHERDKKKETLDLELKTWKMTESIQKFWGLDNPRTVQYRELSSKLEKRYRKATQAERQAIIGSLDVLDDFSKAYENICGENCFPQVIQMTKSLYHLCDTSRHFRTHWDRISDAFRTNDFVTKLGGPLGVLTGCFIPVVGQSVAALTTLAAAKNLISPAEKGPDLQVLALQEVKNVSRQIGGLGRYLGDVGGVLAEQNERLKTQLAEIRKNIDAQTDTTIKEITLSRERLSEKIDQAHCESKVDKTDTDNTSLTLDLSSAVDASRNNPGKRKDKLIGNLHKVVRRLNEHVLDPRRNGFKQVGKDDFQEKYPIELLAEDPQYFTGLFSSTLHDRAVLVPQMNLYLSLLQIFIESDNLLQQVTLTDSEKQTIEEGRATVLTHGKNLLQFLLQRPLATQKAVEAQNTLLEALAERRTATIQQLQKPVKATPQSLSLLEPDQLVAEGKFALLNPKCFLQLDRSCQKGILNATDIPFTHAADSAKTGTKHGTIAGVGILALTSLTCRINPLKVNALLLIAVMAAGGALLGAVDTGTGKEFDTLKSRVRSLDVLLTGKNKLDLQDLEDPQRDPSTLCLFFETAGKLNDLVNSKIEYTTSNSRVRTWENPKWDPRGKCQVLSFSVSDTGQGFHYNKNLVNPETLPHFDLTENHFKELSAYTQSVRRLIESYTTANANEANDIFDEKFLSGSTAIPSMQNDLIPLRFPKKFIEKLDKMVALDKHKLELKGQGTLVPFYDFSHNPNSKQYELVINYRFIASENSKNNKDFAKCTIATLNEKAVNAFSIPTVKHTGDHPSGMIKPGKVNRSEALLQWMYTGFVPNLGVPSHESIDIPDMPGLGIIPLEKPYQGFYHLWEEGSEVIAFDSNIHGSKQEEEEIALEMHTGEDRDAVLSEKGDELEAFENYKKKLYTLHAMLALTVDAEHPNELLNMFQLSGFVSSSSTNSVCDQLAAKNLMPHLDNKVVQATLDTATSSLPAGDLFADLAKGMFSLDPSGVFLEDILGGPGSIAKFQNT